MRKLIATLAVLVLVSCNSRDAAMREFNSAESRFTEGQWHITAFVKDGRQANTDYAAFTFTFMEDGRILATDGHRNYSGNWSVVWEDGTDDEPPTDMYFVISFKQPGALTALNGEWIVMEKERYYLGLSLSNNQDDTDTLAFEKI